MHNSRHSNYYEAKIQLRPLKQNILDFIITHVKSRNDVSIAKIEKIKTGIDIYLTSQKFARALGKKLKKSFKGELKMSRSLHSTDRNTSKKLYRATVLFRT